MPRHVELSVSESYLGRARRPTEPSLDRWAATVAGAEEPSLVIDADEIIVAMSAPLRQLLGTSEPVTGRELLDTLLLIDFSSAGAMLGEGEIVKIPPLLAIHSGGLARGLVRLRSVGGPRTFDAVSSPLTDDGQIVGSITFFSTVRV